MGDPGLHTRTRVRIFLIMLLIPVFAGMTMPPVASAQAFDHSPWTVLLQKHINEEGLVDYEGFLTDREELQTYLASMESVRTKDWLPSDQKAFWINAYNAWMVESILEHWPVKSPLDIDRILKFIPTAGVFKRRHPVAGAQRSLDDIEHRILRGRFKDPRIHGALNCASMSCPKLLNEAYVPGKLDQQLTDAMTRFLMDSTRNRIDARPPQLSSIFKWFKEDFIKHSGSVWEYIRGAVPEEVRPTLPATARPGFMPYDWALNSQK